MITGAHNSGLKYNLSFSSSFLNFCFINVDPLSTSLIEGTPLVGWPNNTLIPDIRMTRGDLCDPENGFVRISILVVNYDAASI
jgi:hypothetical protein